MPFVTLAKIKPLIPNGIAVVLERDSGAKFTEVESQAAIEIRDLAGLEIPTSATNSPDWIVAPAARLITKLALNLVSDLSPEARTSIENDYKTAREELRRRRTEDATEGSSRTIVDTFDGEESW